MDRIKLCVIGVVGVPASYGGFETLVEQLIDDKSVDFYIYCSGKHYADRINDYKGAKLIYIPLSANGVGSIFYDVISLIHALFCGHRNFLVLGVSGALFFPFIRLFRNIKLVSNIDGIEWKREKWQGLAKVFLKFSEYMAVKWSNIVVSDNAAITNYVRREYRRDCKTIAYGGDHAFAEGLVSDSSRNLNEYIHEWYALSICRIEPENNIHVILDAFRKSKMGLVIIGNWDNSDYGKQLFSDYQNCKNIKLIMPIYCVNTLYVYRANCLFYVHGHSAGGTNPSLVEMMHFSKPIVAFDCSFNRATMEGKGNYFSCSDSLVSLVQNIELLESGVALTEIAKRRYTWDVVRKQYLSLFGV